MVRVLDSCLYGRDSLTGLIGHPNFDMVVADCRNVDVVGSAVRGIGAIVFLAGIVGDQACENDPQTTFDTNCEAPRMIARIAKAHNIKRFILASTCSVYGAAEQTVTEDAAVNPVSLYARSKCDSENQLMDVRTPEFNTVVLRFATVFGDSYRPRFDLAVNLLTAHAYYNGTVTIFNGTSWRPFIHVQDVARAVMKAIDAPVELIAGEIFNVGDSRLNYTFNGVAQVLSTRFPAVTIVNGEDRDRRNYRVSFDKISRVLNFASSKPLEYGIEEVKRSLEHGSAGDYRDSRYNNSKFLALAKAAHP
jgi:nucleoside-diphosphate-sugar epimerase